MATATEKRPTELVTLSDGVTALDLILCNAQGKKDARALQKSPYPRTSFKTQQGTTKYADFEPPYFQQAQSVFSGGRARENFDEDSSRFFDSYRLDTTIDEKVILGGLDEFGLGYRSADQQMPGAGSLSCAFTALKGTTAYISDSFVASATYTTGYVLVIARKVGNPAGNLRLALYDNSGGNPGSALGVALVQAQSDVYAKYVVAAFAVALTATTTYHVVVGDTGLPAAGATSYYEVARLDAVSGKGSADGTTWATGPAPYFRVADTEDAAVPHFFNYKGGTYAILNYDDGGTPELYINGDRGAADDNTGNLNKLIDATKAWASGVFAGAYVVLTKGKGAEEEQNWRKISGNDATSLTVDRNWNIIHDTTTEYAIVGSNVWTLISGHGIVAPVTDVTVADEFVYFAQGENTAIRRMQEYNAAGVWTRRYASEASNYKAVFLETIPKSGGGLEVWGALNEHPHYGVCVWHADVPPLWGALMEIFQTIHDTETPWDEQSIGNVTQSTDDRATKITIDAAFGTGVIASKIITADISKANAIAFKIHSTVAVGAGQLQLMLDDSMITLAPPPDYALNLPALNANEWTWVDLAVSPLGGGIGVAESLVSIGLNLTTDLGAQVITLFGGIFGTRDAQIIPVGSDADKINGMRGYIDADNDNRFTLYIFKQGSVWRVLSNVAQKLPLEEMDRVNSIYNGRSSAVGGVFLYFSLQDGLERYFSNQLDDIGPNREAGLPSGRQGFVSSMTTYPGRIFAAVNAGTGGTSSILQLKGDGWHEVYRGFGTGKRIRALHFQSLPSNLARLWVGIETDLVAVPIALNPLNNPDYYFWPEGWLETGWFFANLQDVDKIFKSMAIFSDNLGNAALSLQADYMTDDDTAWTAITGDFDQAPSEEIDLSTTNSVVGKRIKFRLRLRSTTLSLSPIIRALIVKMVAFVPIKYQYSMTVRIADRDTDLYGLPLAQTTLDTINTQLNTWANTATPLTFRSVYSWADNIYVKLEPPSMLPVTVEPGIQHEVGVFSLVAVEL